MADLPRMAAALHHRGPDDEGFWHDAPAGIALCHRRLSIIDLSPLGSQPMRSPSGRYTVAYNGEIYNYRELRDELSSRGYSFRGGSDTEVLLAAVECWQVDGAVERAIGMFAFALWDRQEHLLYLARDRFGEKPLHYGICKDTLLFGSELKALREHRFWRGDVDRDSLAMLMQNDSVPAPHSIFKDIYKLRPGCLLTVRTAGERFHIEEHRYWRVEELMSGKPRSTSRVTKSEYVDTVDAALSRAVRRQMVADVPVGAFLSGGVDSSLVVAHMQQSASRAVKTFSIGFREQGFDESPFAKAVAGHLGTDHTELILTGGECLSVIPELPRIYDEPFADPSQIPTYLVSRLAAGTVKVALSGDGGDELFGGYTRYLIARSKWQRMRWVPIVLRSRGSAIAEMIPDGMLQLLAKSGSLFSERFARQGLALRLSDKSSRWRSTTLDEFYRTGLRRWHGSWQPVIGGTPDAANAAWVQLSGADELKQMMYADTCRYLPDDILVKVDRAAMSVSLETRVPFLDPEVARVAWSIPSPVLTADGRGKWVLRQLLHRYLPSELVERPKAGFAIPLAQWLRGELRPWAAELLDAYTLRQEGYLDAGKVQQRWRQHLSGNANWAQHLWNVLMFQAWHQHWRERSSVARVQAQAS